MSDGQTFDDKHNQHQCSEIRLKGHLDARWAEWFENLTITPEEDGITLLSGPVVDQAALHGLLKKVRDLGLTLIPQLLLGGAIMMEISIAMILLSRVLKYNVNRRVNIIVSLITIAFVVGGGVS